MAGYNFEESQKAKNNAGEIEPWLKAAQAEMPGWSLKTPAADDSENGADDSESAGHGADDSERASHGAGETLDGSSLSSTNVGLNAPFHQPVELQQGTIIGGVYRIEKLIGSGGMGQVYLAEHLGLGKTCALKILPTNQLTEKGWQRFQTEAKTIARLEHPNIVRVTDLGIHEKSLPYFAMEYVDGQSLAQYLSQHGTLDEATTLDMLTQLCSAIACAHKSGIVHRDVKPANIMLIKKEEKGSNFNIKILDFGLAKLSHKDIAAPNLTATGEIFGSPLYMSPEQCSGEPIEARSDIYSLGCTIFECLTGQPPFTGQNPIPIMSKKISQEAPSVSSVLGQGAVSEALEEIVAAMLRKDAQERYQNIEDLQSLLSGKLQASMSQRKKNNLPGRQEEALQPQTDSRSLSRRMVRSIRLRLLAVGSLCLLISSVMLVQCLPVRLPVIAALAPVFFPLCDSPEVLLGCIHQANDSYRLTVKDKKWDESCNQASKMWSDVKHAAQTQLIKLGPRAIPACLNDVESGAMSEGASIEVLEEDGAASIEPAIKRMMDNPMNDQLAMVLYHLGPPATDRLCQLISVDNANRDERVKAIKVLKGLISSATFMRPHLRGRPEEEELHRLSDSNRSILLSALKSETDPFLRQDLLFAISSFQSPNPEAVNALSKILRTDQSDQSRRTAATALGCMLVEASPNSASEIIKILTDAMSASQASESTKVACLEGLTKARTKIGQEQLQQVRGALSHPSQRVSQNALLVLATQAIYNDKCIPDLAAVLAQKAQPTSEATVRGTYRSTIELALDIAQNVGPKGKLLLPALAKIANDPHGKNVNGAIMAICAVGPEGNQEAINAIIKRLDLPPTVDHWGDLQVAIRATSSLSDNEKKEALPALKRLGQDQKFPFSYQAKQAAQGVYRMPGSLLPRLHRND